jgi:aspartyl-tRNA(Asn)/glutamyl-tRNA(Gln) amidotransferase subunit B
LRTVRALGCEIRPNAQFSRKNYFYPDLPKGYQITMYHLPLGVEGHLQMMNEHDKLTNGVGIERVHLEEDTARLFHQGTAGSLVDFNRAGIPLIEIVTKPVIGSAKQAVAYLKELKRLLKFLDISDAKMEDGNFRCELNISIKPEDSEDLGTKVEIKNLNSFRAVERSIEFEIERQTRLLESGSEVRLETRGWDENTDETVHHRFKERSPEYRYFPEPDLPDLLLEGEIMNESAFDLNNIPVRRVCELIERFGVPPYGAELIMSGSGVPDDNRYYMADLLEEAIERHGALGTQAANLMISTVFEFVNKTGKTLDQTDLTAKKLAEITKMVSKEEISIINAKKALSIILSEGGKVKNVVKREGFVLVTEEDEIVTLVKEVMEANEHIVETIRKGKETAISALVGEAMKKSKGNADPRRVNEILRDLIYKKGNRYQHGG